MARRPYKSLGTVAGLVLLTAVGCLERKETITVARDGSVTIELRYKGNEQDMKTDDALPSRDSGWNVKRAVKSEGDEKKHVLTARRTFAPGDALPGTFAAPDDPDANLYLDFPTTIRTQRRPDGLYFHFRRVYTPRKWNTINHWHDHFLESDDIKKLGAKPSDELTTQERVVLFRAFAAVQAFEQVEIARAALAETNSGLPQDHWLLARAALLTVYRDLDYEALVEQYAELTDDERKTRSERDSAELQARGLGRLIDSLQSDAGYQPSGLDRFERSYERAERYHKITGQLGGHAFRITVKLPGEVVAHNADSIDDEGAVWEFDGEAFRDRPFELMITSRVPAGGPVGQ